MSLTGRWQMIRAEFDGQPAPELIVQHTQLHVTPTHYSIRFDGQVADAGTLELAPDEAPAGVFESLILRADTGAHAGRTVPCIYQLMRDRLRVCFGLDGTAPLAFATAPDSHRYLATYRRL